MTSHLPSYHGYRFPPDIISHAVWLYHRFGLSFRDVEDLLAQRGITVTYETIRQWCGRFGPVYARPVAAPAPARAAGGYVASRRAIREHPRAAAVPVARGVGALIQRGGRAVAGMLTIATAGGS